MRLLLHGLTGTTPATFAQSLDSVQTSPDAAFADGLGLLAYAFITGESVVYDGMASSVSSMTYRPSA